MSEPTDEGYVWPIGALALVKPMLDVLNFAAIVDETCPIAEQGGLSHEQVAEALVCNRFTSPTLSYQMKECAADWHTDRCWASPRRSCTTTGWVGPWMPCIPI